LVCSLQVAHVEMRGDWDDEEIETRVFFQPEADHIPAQRVPIPRTLQGAIAPPVRVARGTAPTPTMIVVPEPALDERRFSIPSLATIAVRRQRTFNPLHVGLASVCALLGITIGGLIAFTGHAQVDAHAAPVRATATPIVTPAPVVVAPAPVPATPVLVVLHVESTPPGASVMLVGDAGATTLVGTTPVDTQVEAARDYDVLVKLPEHAPRVEHVGAASSHHVVIAFDAAAPEPTIAAPVHHHHVAAAPVASTSAAVKGSLRIAAKPPCSIAIDGKSTGMVTPQASIALTAGHHTVTLTNAEQGISLTKDVTIEADHATSLIQNFLD
jgi:hypothetical protein